MWGSVKSSTYTIPWYGGMATLYHSRVFCHTTASYTIPVVLSVNQYQTYHHGIPVILYHGSHRVAGVLSQKIQKYFCRLLGAIMNRLELGNFLSILRHQTIPASEIQAVKERLKADWQDPKSLHTQILDTCTTKSPHSKMVTPPAICSCK